MKIKCVSLVAAVVVAFTAFADKDFSKESLKVLSIGNSFSSCLMKEMPNVAKAMGLKLDLCVMFIGGCPLEKHVGYLEKEEINPYLIYWNYASCKKGAEPFREALSKNDKKREVSNIVKMLKADKWDVVVVQQASHLSWIAKSYEPYGSVLVDAIKKNAPQAKVYVQQTWSYTPWDGRLNGWKIDQNIMFDRLKDAYAKFAKAHDLGVIPVGEAVQRYRRDLPVKYAENANADDVAGVSTFKKITKPVAWVPKGIERTSASESVEWWPSGDVFHLNGKGYYLQALVWTAKLFNADVTKCSYVPNVLKAKPERAELMRKIAAEVVSAY